MDLPVVLLFPLAFSHHDIDSTGSTMVFLGRMERQHIGELRQPFSEIALELGHTVRITFSLTVKDNNGPQPVPDTITNKPEYIPARLLDGQAMQVQPGFNGVLPKPEPAENPVLNSGALPAEYVVRCQGVDNVEGQRISVSEPRFYGSALTLQVAWRQFTGRDYLGAIRFSNTPDVLHFLKKTESIIFGSHGRAFNNLLNGRTLPPGTLPIKKAGRLYKLVIKSSATG